VSIPKTNGAKKPAEVNPMQNHILSKSQNLEKDIAERYSSRISPTDGLKTILYRVSGFAKPGELLAIMGGSGSGKSTFLDFLSQRIKLPPGSYYSGKIRANDREIKS
jgi:ABC-type multidrug transport system ATPase subunit